VSERERANQPPLPVFCKAKVVAIDPNRQKKALLPHPPGGSVNRRYLFPRKAKVAAIDPNRLRSLNHQARLRRVNMNMILLCPVFSEKRCITLSILLGGLAQHISLLFALDPAE